MSLLSRLIQDVRNDLKNKSSDLEASVTNFISGINGELHGLHVQKNLRVFHDGFGGVLRGPRLDRAKYENGETLNLLCRADQFSKDYFEVAYFRAVFNSASRILTAALQPESTLYILGYESPLMRKWEDGEDSEISSRALACDLVALGSNNRILCIEGKVNPHGKVTDIVYGLLEGLAYGACVDYLLANCREQFIREIQACIDEFHPRTKPPIDVGRLSAAFALAAPRDYFAEFFLPKGMTKKEMTKRKANKRLGEAQRLLDVFQSLKSPLWAGFLILSPPCNVAHFDLKGNIDVDGNACIEPRFKLDNLNVSLATDIESLKSAVIPLAATA